jgi:hypothetical protein
LTLNGVFAGPSPLPWCAANLSVCIDVGFPPFALVPTACETSQRRRCYLSYALECHFFADVFNFSGFAERIVRNAIKLSDISIEVLRDEGSEIPNIEKIN